LSTELLTKLLNIKEVTTMKNELGLDEIRGFIKRFEKKNNLKTAVIIVAGIAIVVFVVIYIILKVKDRMTWGDYADFDDDYDEFDYEDYLDDDDDDDISEDYHALDFEDEEESTDSDKDEDKE
jgi:hypothetical protein